VQSSQRASLDSDAPHGRTVIVSNRLPVTIAERDGQLSLQPSSGGLATGLAQPHEQSEGLWIGWPGQLESLSAADRERVERWLSERRFVPISLSAQEVTRYYEGYSNGLLWPQFHYLSGQIALDAEDFEIYEQVNDRFAAEIARQYRPGDRIWIHDYQLLRVPALLRKRVPHARIGFFLHIPFPSSEVFRTIPQRELLLEGMLGADLIGFHTASYMRHFATSVLRIHGAAFDMDHVRWRARTVRIGVYPMGIDAQSFIEESERPAIEERVREIRGPEPVKILLGVDRLDFTKGIRRRLLAFERMLKQHPDLRGGVRLVQLAVPSRQDVEAYRDLRSTTDELIGRIHGEFATPQWVPVHWMYRSFSREELVALYRAADVMLVTPLRDGMNLVAKEFLASRVDGDGVLVLSEFAGAASELAEAIQVNPFDIEGSAAAYHRALMLPEDDRRARMEAMRQRVIHADVHAWAARFLRTLDSIKTLDASAGIEMTPEDELQALTRRLRAAEQLVLLLDYDGTMVPFASVPELARPDRELLELLAALAERPRTNVHVVSGRGPTRLGGWLGHLRIALHAEHGLWTRAVGGEWRSEHVASPSWRNRVLATLREFAANTPGSLVEEKTVGLAWHYRGADPEFGEWQANELKLHLTELLANAPVEILPGNKVIEVRPYGISKALAVHNALASIGADALTLAVGDDRTDEDMFAALPASGVAVHVGEHQSRAPYRIPDVAAARALLRSLL
jgi:trehalose 6-phosphate synthase/phosphatase